MSQTSNSSKIIKPSLNKMAISRLVHEKILGNLGYGFYTENPIFFILKNDDLMIEINKLLDKFPVLPRRVTFSSMSLNFCINQQISTTTYIVEVEREYLQSVFELLKSNFKNVVLLNPSKEDKLNYWKPNSIYVVELFKRSPVNQNGLISIEKLIVDLLFDENIYSLYSGQDVDSAIDILSSKYTINFKTLFAYASRKGKKKQILERIKHNIPSEILEVIIDD